jgi:hypothetical protein
MTYYTVQNGNIAICINGSGTLYIGSDQSVTTRHALFETQEDAERAVAALWPKGIACYYILSEPPIFKKGI